MQPRHKDAAPVKPGRRCQAPQRSLVLFFLEGVFVVEYAFIVVVYLLAVVVFFVVVKVIVFVILVVVFVGELEVVRTCEHERLAAFGAAQLIALLVVSGVNLVEFALGARRHGGSMQPVRRAAEIGKTAASISGYSTSRERPDYIGIPITSAMHSKGHSALLRYI